MIIILPDRWSGLSFDDKTLKTRYNNLYTEKILSCIRDDITRSLHEHFTEDQAYLP